MPPSTSGTPAPSLNGPATLIPNKNPMYIQTLYAHRLQFYRAILALLTGVHLSFTVSYLYFVIATQRSTLIAPVLLSSLVSLSSRLIWIPLFKSPEQFAGYKRPGRRYRAVVLGTAVATTVPGFGVNIWMLARSWTLKTGRVQSLGAVWAWGVACSMAWYMVGRFLWDWDGGGGFEPVVRGLDAVIEEYRDDVSEGEEIVEGELERAWREQRERQRNASLIDQEGHVPPSEETNEGNEQEQQQNQHGESQSLDPAPAPPYLRCPTLARFDYVPQRHIGLHTWPSLPIFPLVSSIGATIILFPILLFVAANASSRHPAPTAHASLYMPLAIYLLAFYTLKHQHRASLFERRSLPPPEPWMEVRSGLLPWLGSMWRKSFADRLTRKDPRMRAFPHHARNKEAALRTRAYIQAYNEVGPGEATCRGYWGHQGREWKSIFRTRPTAVRLGYLVLVILVWVKGYWAVFAVNAIKLLEEYSKDPATTEGDWVRYRQIMTLDVWIFAYATPLFIFLLLDVLMLGTSLVVLWGRCISDYVEREKRGEIRIGVDTL
ncbi:hypothetical protein BS50DRAFT_570350 [Corynespora cassiicola Philippines]|uniref:Uncharacterized protein n=1 Tax=Corynespora cassiicola Philippines TaxID=1448308 RepID=A0A2T2NZR5_CORCC|nr:hypothetical protein BS50DRAFT_570350 [Corynespora cassiicola Philippines]